VIQKEHIITTQKQHLRKEKIVNKSYSNNQNVFDIIL